MTAKNYSSSIGANDVANESRFDAADAFLYGVSKSMKPDLYGSAVAEQYAAMIVRYWRECRRMRRLDPSEPLDIIDLCPGGNTAGALLMGAILRRIDNKGEHGIRYLPWLGPVGTAAAELADTGAALVWSLAEGERGLVVQYQEDKFSSAYRARNPVVVVAHDAWVQMPQELYAIHYGKLLRANLKVLENGEQADDDKLWEPVDDSCWDSALYSRLAHYRLEFNSSPLVYPRGALNTLAFLSAVADRGVMILSCSPGCASEVLLRLTPFAEVTSVYRTTGRLPTNFQLTACWARAQGGAAAEVELPGDRVLQLLLLGKDAPCAEQLEAVLRCVDSSLLVSAPQLAEVARALSSGASLDVRLCLLRMSRFDPSVFKAGASEILRALSKSRDVDHRRWREALERVWNNHLLYPTDEELYHWVAQAAMHCGHWGLARNALQHGLAKYGDNVRDLANLAWCEARTGKLGKSIELVTCALAMDPGHILANEVSCRLGARLAVRDGHWNVELKDPELPIRLEPLDASHAPALSYQYRDAQIAVMTGLPAMSDPDKVRQWIEESDDDPGRVNYAVMHEDWGFVGFINLAVSGHAAFFCFWTGIDFQGQGIATAAGRLACRHAAVCGVPLMLTSAYKDNHRSLRALRRLGFRELTIRARPPDHERIFFALVDPSGGAFDSNAELSDYYRRENLPMEFDLQGPASPTTAVGDVEIARSKL